MNISERKIVLEVYDEEDVSQQNKFILYYLIN